MANHFDDMDALTAQMCISLQLEDIAALMTSKSTTLPPDQDVALQLQETELKAYRAQRGLPATERFSCKACHEHFTVDEHLRAEGLRGYCGGCLQERFAHPPPAEPAPIVRARCEACGDQFTAEHCVETPCLHHYCDGCLEELFSLSMRDKTLYPPRCCRQKIPWEDVRHIVTGGLREEFEEKQEELEDKNPIYCHEKRCSTYIKAADKHADKVDCPTCLSTTCMICKQGAHRGACPEDEEAQKMREYAKTQGNQECSQCHQLVELSIGCNHITHVQTSLFTAATTNILSLSCLCRHQFCYSCGVQWKNCPCAQFEEANLLQRANEVAARPGMGGVAAAPAIAQHLRRGHQACDRDGHGYMERVEEGDLRCESCSKSMYEFIFRCFTCHTQLCHRCKNNRV